MRYLQIIMFILGIASLIGSALGLGSDFGKTFYGVGVSLLLIDAVWIQLWPAPKGYERE